jgi:hypothetical protein
VGVKKLFALINILWTILVDAFIKIYCEMSLLMKGTLQDFFSLHTPLQMAALEDK